MRTYIPVAANHWSAGHGLCSGRSSPVSPDRGLKFLFRASEDVPVENWPRFDTEAAARAYADEHGGLVVGIADVEVIG